MAEDEANAASADDAEVVPLQGEEFSSPVSAGEAPSPKQTSPPPAATAPAAPLAAREVEDDEEEEARPLKEEAPINEAPKCASAPAAMVPNPLSELAAIRARHHEKYREREEEAEKEEEERRQKQEEEQRLAQEKEDAELAAKLAEEEEQTRHSQMEADEEYSRQLAAQLNNNNAPVPGAGGHSRSYGGASGGDSATGSEMVPIPLDESDSELGGHYHQMEDEEGYIAPMRTGYTDRLIEPAQDLFQTPLFQQLLLARAAAGRRAAGRQPLARVGDEEAGNARELGLGDRCRPLVATALPVVCLGTLFAMLVVLMVQGN